MEFNVLALAGWADLMEFCPAKLEPVLPVSEQELADLCPQPRLWEYRVCGLR